MVSEGGGGGGGREGGPSRRAMCWECGIRGCGLGPQWKMGQELTTGGRSRLGPPCPEVWLSRGREWNPIGLVKNVLGDSKVQPCLISHCFSLKVMWCP